ncbi:hypothetical protein ACLOJK_002961 [Asimina triloba]
MEQATYLIAVFVAADALPLSKSSRCHRWPIWHFATSLSPTKHSGRNSHPTTSTWYGPALARPPPYLLRGQVTRILASMADKQGPAFILRAGSEPCPATVGLRRALGMQEHDVGVRKIITVEILSARRLESFKHFCLAEIDMNMKRLHREWVKKGGEKLIIEMRNWLLDLSFNVMTMILAGKRYFGSHSISDEGEARRFQHAMEEALHLIGGLERAMKSVAAELDSLMGSWLADHRQKRQQLGKVDGGDRDFLDVMLSTIEEEPLAGYGSDSVAKATSSRQLNKFCSGFQKTGRYLLKREIDGIFKDGFICTHCPISAVSSQIVWMQVLLLDGTDTSSITTSWDLSMLLKNHHVLRRDQDELDIHVGRNRHVDDSDIKNLVYLQAIIKESMRLYLPAPLLIAHEAIEDFSMGGFRIHADTRVFFDAWKMHRNPRIWSEPTEFQPERFLTRHAGLDVRGQNFEFLPFRSGQRICPGDTFAMQLMHLTVARLLQPFDLDTPDGAPVDMTEGLGLTMPRETPLQVLLTTRLPSSLYQQCIHHIEHKLAASRGCNLGS